MHKDAMEDGIRFKESLSNYDSTKYYPLCECGSEVMVWSYMRGKKYLCKACRLQKHLDDNCDRVAVNHETQENRFKTAIARIIEVAPNPNAYEYAFSAIQSKIHRDGWFQSTEEMMVGIELVKCKVKARHQVKHGRFKVDFQLDDEKVVLEIDGAFHNSDTREKESFRDGLILAHLGPEWEVVRIPTTVLNQNVTRLMDAITQLKKERASVRKKNGGQLPNWYTDRAVC